MIRVNGKAQIGVFQLDDKDTLIELNNLVLGHAGTLDESTKGVYLLKYQAIIEYISERYKEADELADKILAESEKPKPEDNK